MSKGYVVVEYGYQYNDEYYYREGNEYTIQSTIYADKETAKSICAKKEWEEYKGLPIGNYGEEIIEDHFEEISQILGGDYDENDCPWDVELPEDLTFEQYKKIKEITRIELFEVVEVDVSSEFQKS